ncbi:sugar-binding protein [Metabacillus indicus]|uniref:sugar-binding protein n=1 Tax=Metabacillus indicus TaxID=246786 RepID=UPI003178AA09
MKKTYPMLLAILFLLSTVLTQIGLLTPKYVNASDSSVEVKGMEFSRLATTEMAIDGMLEEEIWNPESTLTHSIVGESSDNNVTFDTAWDSENLYIAVKVLDNKVINNNHDQNLYEDDSIEIFLDGDNAKDASYDENDHQIFIRASDNAVITRQKNADTNFKEHLTSATAMIEGGYVLEMKVPFQALGASAKQGHLIGFDISNNDNDSDDGTSGRSSTISWNANENTNYKSAAAFGTLVFINDKGPVISNAGTPIIDGEISSDNWQLHSTMEAGNNEVRFGSLSDENYLYIGIEIDDDHVISDSGKESYELDDSIELFIDSNNSRSPFDEEDRHFIAAYDQELTEVSGGKTEGVEVKSKRTSSGWSAEIAVPWTNLKIMPKDLLTFGIDIKVNDDDQGGDTSAGSGTWAGDENNAASTAGYGILFINNKNIQLPEYTGPKETFVDDAVDFSKVYEKSSKTLLSTSLKAGSFGEGPRFVNGWAKDQYVIYKSPSSDLISFEVEALEQSQPWVEIYTSPDNENYTKLAKNVQYSTIVETSASSETGWYALHKYKSLNLPEGTRYVKLLFTTDSSNGHKAAIEAVSFDYKLAYSGPVVSFVDDTEDLSVLAGYKNIYLNKKNFGDNTNKYAAYLNNEDEGKIKPFIKYKSPSGHFLSFEMEAVINPGQAPNPTFELYESSDDKNYTKVNLTSSVTVEAGSGTGWFEKRVYKTDRFKTNSKFVKIEYQAAKDKLWAADIATVAFDVARVNTPPTSLANIQKIVEMNTAVTGYVKGRDDDEEDSLTYKVLTPPKNGTAVINDEKTDEWTYTPNKDYIGYDYFEVEVTDEFGGSDISKIVIHENYKPANKDYYVSSKKGDDNHDGLSKNKPFKTIQKAHDVSKPGDTIYIMNGTYLDVGKEGVVEIKRSGLPDAYITYKAYPGHKPILHNKKGWNHILVSSASYIKIEGLEIKGNADQVSIEEAEAIYNRFVNEGASWGPDVSYANANGIGIRPTNGTAFEVIPHHIEIRDNHVHNIPGGGIYSTHADYLFVENNTVHDTAIRSIFANSGISMYEAQDIDDNTDEYKIVIKNNLVHNNEAKVKWFKSKGWSDGNGIIIDDFKSTQNPGEPYKGKTLIENNIAYENGGSGIHSYESTNVDIINNTAYHNNVTPELNWGQIFATSSANIRIYNNILVAKEGREINANYNNKNVEYDYNIYFGGNAPKIPGQHDVISDPLFAEPSTYNFRLQVNSPAVDTGLADVAPTHDYYGVTRPEGAGVDRGAIEFVNEAPKPKEKKKIKFSVQNGLATIKDKELQKGLDPNVLLVFDFKKADHIKLQFTKEQIKQIKNKKTSLLIFNKDMSLYVPATGLPENQSIIEIKEKTRLKGSITNTYKMTVYDEQKEYRQFNEALVLSLKVTKEGNVQNYADIYYFDHQLKKWVRSGGEYKKRELSAKITQLGSFTGFDHE